MNQTPVGAFKMNPTIEFENCHGYACFRPSGEVTFNAAVGIIGALLGQVQLQIVEVRKVPANGAD